MSFDGSQYQLVDGPIAVDAETQPVLWVWADDAVGNRASSAVPVIDPLSISVDGFESGTLGSWTRWPP